MRESRHRGRQAIAAQVPRPSATAALRVVIADDSYLIREGLQQVLALAPQLRVVGGCADAPSLLAAVDADPPDVVVTDIRMPPTQTDEGMQIAKRLRQTHPHIGVVVLSQHESWHYAAELLGLGGGGPRLPAQGSHPRPRSSGLDDHRGRRRRVPDRRASDRRTGGASAQPTSSRRSTT